MKYADGNTAQVGDCVAIGSSERGVVVGVMPAATRRDVASDPYPSVPTTGLMINTDVGGLVHYVTVEDVQDDNIRLLSRAKSSPAA